MKYEAEHEVGKDILKVRAPSISVLNCVVMEAFSRATELDCCGCEDPS